jgi:hypothetical protein
MPATTPLVRRYEDLSDVDVLSNIYGTTPVFQERPTAMSQMSSLRIGGARRDRTADLLNAIQALSHLSYGPAAKAKVACRNVKPVLNPLPPAPQQK